MTILVFGKDGQVGRALQLLLAPQPGVIFLGRNDCDLADPQALEALLEKYRPNCIINASAYTAVDRAETEMDLAFAVNEVAVGVMARYIAKQELAVLLHYSTDYVFGDRQMAPHPYLEADLPGPLERLGVYGRSKLAGESLIQKHFLNSSSKYYILRTSWVYGAGKNFIRTMFQLASEKDSLRVVGDQYGAPTAADWLARLADLFVEYQPTSGIYHAVPNGYTTWYQLAILAIQSARRFGYPIQVTDEKILKISTIDYPLPAPRPYNSCLDNAKLKSFLASLPYPEIIPDWEEPVMHYVSTLVSLSQDKGMK